MKRRYRYGPAMGFKVLLVKSLIRCLIFECPREYNPPSSAMSWKPKGSWMALCCLTMKVLFSTHIPLTDKNYRNGGSSFIQASDWKFGDTHCQYKIPSLSLNVVWVSPVECWADHSSTRHFFSWTCTLSCFASKTQRPMLVPLLQIHYWPHLLCLVPH